MKRIAEFLRSVFASKSIEGSTYEAAITSGFWSSGINVGERTLQLSKIIILAQLLSPEDFGLLGIGLVVLAGLNQFTELGIDQSLIQQEEEDVGEYLNTAWVIQILRGSLIAIIGLVSAPSIAYLLREPRSVLLIQVICFLPFILSIRNPASIYFQKHLNFHKEFVYIIGGVIIDFLAAIIFAIIYKNVWALVAGRLLGNISRVAISYLIHQYRPGFGFSLEHAREMLDFGKWLFLSSILFFLYAQADDAFVGWYFGAASLGFYQVAYRFSNAPATEISQVISRVAFPAFSKVQRDKDRLRSGLFQVIQLASFVSFPTSIGILIVAPYFVLTFFGPDWSPMIPLIQILVIAGSMRSLVAGSGSLFKAVGRPDFETKLQLFKVIIIGVLILPFSAKFGVEGVAGVIAINTFIVQPILIYLSLKIVEGSYKRLIYVLYPQLIGSLAMGILLKGIDFYFLQGPSIWSFFILVLSGAIIYTIVAGVLLYYSDNNIILFDLIIKKFLNLTPYI